MLWLISLFFLTLSPGHADPGGFQEHPNTSQTDLEALGVIGRHLEAIGGEERLRAVRTMVLDCRVGNVSGNPRKLTKYFMSPN
jgi:hypothetical protein